MKALFAASLLPLSAAALAQDASEPPTPASVVAAAKADEWKPIDPAELLVMDLAPDRDGKERRVIVQLIPPPFSQGWVENIRTLARAHWWDGTSVYRVVDNWVAQWGDVDEVRALPEEVSEQPDDSYTASIYGQGAELAAKTVMSPWTVFDDSYSHEARILNGWPVGFSSDDKAWPTHCYGSIGVARSVGSGGTGSELYAVIGHAPRQLDRNIAVVGRVIEGIEHLSTLPRGPAATNGVYEDKEQRVPIRKVRLGNELKEFPQPRFEYLDSESESFAAYVHVRANRQDAFYLHPAGGIDVCNVQPPIRRVPSD